MKSRLSKWLLSSAAILLVLAFAVWVALNRAPAPHQSKLSDGTFVQLAGVTFGKSHRLPSNWRSRLGRFAPPAMKPLFGPSFGSSFGFGDPGLAAWLMLYDPAKPGYSSGGLQACHAVDEHGCVFEARGMGSTGDGHFMANIVSFPAYPRRQASFTCRLIGLRGEALGELTLPNPQISTQSSWAAQPFPIRLTNGPLEFVIRGFEETLTPVFDVCRNGQREDFWRAEETAFEDATGNRGSALCRHESAWQWTATLHRRIDAPFASAEIATLANSPVPAPGALTNLAVSLKIGETTVTNVILAGPGRHDWSNDVHVASIPYAPGMGSSSLGSSSGGFPNAHRTIWRSCQKPFVILPKLPTQAPARLIVRARSNGEILGEAENSGAVASMHFYDLPLGLPPTVELDFIPDPATSSARAFRPGTFQAQTHPPTLRSQRARWTKQPLFFSVFTAYWPLGCRGQPAGIRTKPHVTRRHFGPAGRKGGGFHRLARSARILIRGHGSRSFRVSVRPKPSLQALL